jgi:hypothetical protein
MFEHGMIAPALALVLWSLVIFVWLYATRIPAMQKAKIDPQSVKLAGSGRGLLPPSVEQVANNYNHLMEQPTIFYAACFAAQLADQADPLNIQLAWGYVALRIVHSLVQCTINIVMLRFLIFLSATIALAALAIRTAIGLWG